MYNDGMLPKETDFKSIGKCMYDASRFVSEPKGLFENVNENVGDQHSLPFNVPWNPAVPASQSFLQPSLCQAEECARNGFWCQETDVSVFFSKHGLNLL